MYGPLLFAHLVGVVVWLGGMFFATFCLHPSLAALTGKDRAVLVCASLGRFLNYVIAAIVLIWASGLGLVAGAGTGGMQGMPMGWRLMIGIGVLMTVIFAYLFLGLFRPARRALERGDMATLALLLGRIRTLVLTNLVLGTAAIASVTMVR